MNRKDAIYRSLDFKLGKNNKADAVEHPNHYCSHSSGIECIEVTRHMNFCLGSATKYIWRVDLKEDTIKDLGKAVKFLEFEIETIEKKSRFLSMISKYLNKINPWKKIKNIDKLINTITADESCNIGVALRDILEVGLKKTDSVFDLKEAIRFLKLEIELRRASNG